MTQVEITLIAEAQIEVASTTTLKVFASIISTLA
jgi:hypothetical protein